MSVKPEQRIHFQGGVYINIEAYERVREERDEARSTADGMARAPYGEFEKMREQRDTAQARLDRAESVIRKIAMQPDLLGDSGRAVALAQKRAAQEYLDGER